MSKYLPYIKATILSILLFAESFVLLTLIYELAHSSSLLEFNYIILIKIIAVMLFLKYTIILTLGIWDTWQQYVFVVLPVIIAIFIILFTAGSEYAIITPLIIGVILVIEISKSTHLKSILLKEDPKIIIRFASRGLLLVFSILGAVITLIDPTFRRDIDLGHTISEASGQYVENLLKSQIENQLQKNTPSPLVWEDETKYDPALLEEFNIDIDKITQEGITTVTDSIDIKGIIKDRVNTITAPYKEFIQPVFSVITFGILQVLSWTSLLIYTLTVDLLFWLAKKTKFIRIEKIQAEKEILKF